MIFKKSLEVLKFLPKVVTWNNKSLVERVKSNHMNYF